MLRLLLLLAALALAPSPPSAQVVDNGTIPPNSLAEKSRVRIETSAGPITVEVDVRHAPVTAKNFLRYVDARRYDGAVFYRALKLLPDGSAGLVQGGIRDARKLYPAIRHEPTTETGLTHDDGAISMARAAPGSAQADFFLIVGKVPSLDADAKTSGDNQGFAAFGHVVDGMETVRKILGQPTDPNRGEGVMKGQMLTEPVKIISARRDGEGV
ncbi:MAG: peptidylprolyl isomerase [Sphingomonadaceae bacterium]|nr:peptidylprolyl isomerase [Sphingomonadaceae bacterium]